jgi:hypothetical protein
MFAGQVNWSNPANAAGQQALPPNFAAGEESETAFALVYEAVLGLADDQCSRSGASNNWLDTDGEGDLPETQDSSRLNGAMSVGSGVGAYGSTGQNSNSEIAFAFPGAANYGSSMERFMSRSSQAQLEPVPTQAAGIDPAWATNRARLDGNRAQPSGLSGDVAAPSNSGGNLNKSQLSDWMDAHALSRSSHHCAMYCRLGMEAAGLNTADRPQSGDAGDYGPFLMRHGAQTVPSDSYVPQTGDVVVFNKTDQHPSGHIEMYDGQHWVSDFMQHAFSPYRDAMSTPPFTIYRLS